MPVESDPDLLVLHTLRLKSVVETDQLVELSGVDAALAASILRRRSDEGAVRHREGSLAGWMLGPEGRSIGESLLADELASSGSADTVEHCYRRFRELNRTFLELCTDWQIRDRSAELINDHSDAVHDRAVIGRLGELHRQLMPVCRELAAVLSRFDSYAPRFERAYDRVVAGETDWFARPMIDSYHSVWFELHENLLATLGIERAKETR